MMDAEPQTLRDYVTPDGTNPFRKWLHALRNISARAKVRVRLNRVRLGNFGHTKAVGSDAPNSGYRTVRGIGCTSHAREGPLFCFSAAETSHRRNMI